MHHFRAGKILPLPPPQKSTIEVCPADVRLAAGDLKQGDLKDEHYILVPVYTQRTGITSQIDMRAERIFADEPALSQPSSAIICQTMAAESADR